mmetsp:Transcript_30648/g.72311  ORF Transcript_30648/g.72311 Transcript_30648/m.72311 type:complete len:201 (-) Transcript_30648:1461-2063(-)
MMKMARQSGRVRKSSLKRLSFDSDNGRDNEPKSVQFTTIEIRDYAQCLGDHPDVNRGAPVSLDWDYQSEQCYDIEEYERKCSQKKSEQQMIQLAFEREYILQKLGYSQEEIYTRSKSVKNDRKKRSQTRRTMIFEPFIILAEDTKRWIAKRKDIKNEGKGEKGLIRSSSNGSFTCLSSGSEASAMFPTEYLTKGSVLCGQ